MDCGDLVIKETETFCDDDVHWGNCQTLSNYEDRSLGGSARKQQNFISTLVLLSVIGLVTFKKLFNGHSDDWIDKLNHSYTVIILVIFSTVITTAGFVGDPIFCWVPAEFTDAFVAYSKWYCWTQNTYFVPMHDEIPTDIAVRQIAEISYYQWTPIILLFMAFLFKFPNILWRMLNFRNGLSVDKLTKNAEQCMCPNPEERKKNIADLAYFMDMWLLSRHYYQHNFVARANKKLSNVLVVVCNERGGKYLSALYCSIKLCYMINVIAQFYLLNAFLGIDFSTYGYRILEGLSDRTNWQLSPRFPRVTLCDFQIRHLASIQRYTVQCVLPINLFNEKIFMFLWFWLFLVAVLTSYNLLKWFIILAVKRNNYRFARNYLKIGLLAKKCKENGLEALDENMSEKLDRMLCKKFANNYLRDDGCFVLRMISTNCSDLVVIDLVQELWKLYTSPIASQSKYADDACQTSLTDE